jgi:hypothetical protein
MPEVSRLKEARQFFTLVLGLMVIGVLCVLVYYNDQNTTKIAQLQTQVNRLQNQPTPNLQKQIYECVTYGVNCH